MDETTGLRDLRLLQEVSQGVSGGAGLEPGPPPASAAYALQPCALLPGASVDFSVKLSSSSLSRLIYS